MNSDSLFDSLPKHTQRLIDDAFDRSIQQSNSSRRPFGNRDPHPKVTQDSIGTSGGFLPAASTGGGFIIEDTEEEGDSDHPLEIPFNSIPSALQLLDLPPDDQEILAVLRNAASGWTSTSAHPPGVDLEGGYVSREDWRSVCAVLLEHTVSEADEHQLDGSSQYAQDQDEDMSADDSNYMEDGAESDDSEDEFEDEYYPSQSQRAKAPRPDQHHAVSLKDPQKPSRRQRQTCLEAFGLFFPESSPQDLPKQRILMADLQRVSALIGEKTKTEELLEMLEMFSTSPDKAMNFEDFTQMMITARLA